MTASAAVVICTRDRPQFLEDVVASVAAGTVLPAEIVVVDQSVDPHVHLAGADVVGGSRIRYIHDRGRGLGRARNLGSGHTRCEVLAYCDDDVLADHRWLEMLLAALEQGDPSVAVTGRVLAGRPERSGAYVPAVVVAEAPVTYAGRLDRDVLAGGNCALLRATLELVGGWDDRLGAGSPFPSAEDNDLGLRLLEAGCRIVYVPEAVLHHRSWRPGWEYPRTRWRYGLGKGGFYAKHVSKRWIRRRAVRDLARRLLRFAATVARRPVYAAGELTYAAGVLVGGVSWAAHAAARRR